MKKLIACALSAVTMMASLSGCSFLNGGNGGNGGDSDWKDYDNLADYIATEYDNEAVVEADETDAGDVLTWYAEVFSDKATNNALIKSPYHTLKVNGKEVPVYSARAAKGVHSFAWLDIKDSPKEFMVKAEVTLNEAFAKCVMLPESRAVPLKVEGQTITSYLNKYDSFTYTFTEDATAEVTDPNFAPLTIMITPELDTEAPNGYETVEIEPGYHEDKELVFTQEETMYVMKEGLHEITEVRVPSNSILVLERGAYLQSSDRYDEKLGWNRQTPIHFDDIENSELRSRGLLDCGHQLGGDGKYKHVFNVGRSTDVRIEGLTVINANTWSMCFYNSDNVEIERNLLIGFRTYSDGIMMSECRNSVGRYNFVRTGDDAIEFKATGWGGKNDGHDCLYEYNTVWTDKATAYGIIWESECNMSNMTFKNNSVGFAQPTWSGGNNALDCRLGTNPERRWGDVTFENIEIYHVISPNVIIIQVSGNGAIVDNIHYKNINVKSTEFGTYAFQMYYGAAGGSISNITIEDYTFCGKKLTAADKNDSTLFANKAMDFFDDELTIK